MTAPTGFTPVSLTGFAAALGTVSGQPAEAPDGSDRYHMTLSSDHLSADGQVHGGVLMTLAQAALADRVAREAAGHSTANISLNCDFVAGAEPVTALDVLVDVTKRTRTILFLNGEIAAAQPGGTRGPVLMTATGLWKIAVAV